MIDSSLEEFLKIEKIKAEDLLNSCARIKEIEGNPLYSLDYILACTEYEDFYNLMLQYKVIKKLNYFKYFIIFYNFINHKFFRRCSIMNLLMKIKISRIINRNF